MVRINGDFDKKVIIQSDELEWKPSRYPGVSRRCGSDYDAVERFSHAVERISIHFELSSGQQQSRSTGEVNYSLQLVLLDGGSLKSFSRALSRAGFSESSGSACSLSVASILFQVCDLLGTV